MSTCDVLQVLTPVTPQHDIMLALYGNVMLWENSAGLHKNDSTLTALQNPSLLQNPVLQGMNKTINFPVIAKNQLHFPSSPLSPSVPYYFSAP